MSLRKSHHPLGPDTRNTRGQSNSSRGLMPGATPRALANKAGMSFGFRGIVVATPLPIQDSRLRRVDGRRRMGLAWAGGRADTSWLKVNHHGLQI